MPIPTHTQVWVAALICEKALEFYPEDGSVPSGPEQSVIASKVAFAASLLV